MSGCGPADEEHSRELMPFTPEGEGDFAREFQPGGDSLASGLWRLFSSGVTAIAIPPGTWGIRCGCRHICVRASRSSGGDEPKRWIGVRAGIGPAPEETGQTVAKHRAGRFRLEAAWPKNNGERPGLEALDVGGLRERILGERTKDRLPPMHAGVAG